MSESASTPPAPDRNAVEAKPTEPLANSIAYRRVRNGLLITLAGFVLFLLGARPGIFGLDRSSVIGFVQIAVFLVGLAIICLGGYTTLTALWGKHPRSIAADIGFRLVSTGYVITVFAGMADVFGFGSHPLPGVPYFGPWQARGVEAGQAVIALGFLLMIPWTTPRD